MSNIREVVEGQQEQGEDEEIVYTVDTANWGGSPTSPSVVVKDPAGTNVTSTVMPSGSATVNGDVITLPTLKLLTRNKLYRVEVKFTAGGNVFEAVIPVWCTE